MVAVLQDLEIRRVIGSRIRQLREASPHTAIDLAEASGVARGYWYEIERGEVNPTLDVLMAIARTLGVSVGDLIGKPRRG